MCNAHAFIVSCKHCSPKVLSPKITLIHLSNYYCHIKTQQLVTSGKCDSKLCALVGSFGLIVFVFGRFKCVED